MPPQPRSRGNYSPRNNLAARVIAISSATGVIVGALHATAIEAKAPGVRHCYKGVCHRVRTIDETRRLIGKTRLISASHYDFPHLDRFNAGTFTSNGERFHAGRSDRVSSSDLPDGTELVIRNPANGRTAHVRVNDFGPFHGNRRLDVTRKVAEDLGFAKQGVVDLQVTVIAAPLPEDLIYRRNRQRLSARGYLGAIADDDMAALIGRKIAERTPVEADAVVAAAPGAAEPPAITNLAGTTEAASHPAVDLDQQPPTQAADGSASHKAEPVAVPAMAQPAELATATTIAEVAAINASLVDHSAAPTSAGSERDSPIGQEQGLEDLQRLSAAVTVAEVDWPVATIETTTEPLSPSASEGDAATTTAAPEHGPAFTAPTIAHSLADDPVRSPPSAPLLRPSSALLALIMVMLSALMTVSATRSPRVRSTATRTTVPGDRSFPRIAHSGRANIPAASTEPVLSLSLHGAPDSPRPPTVAETASSAEAHRVTFIAPGTEVIAKLTGPGRIVVAGTLAGSFDVTSLKIVPGGRVHGQVIADTVEIDGDYHGALTVRRAHLLKHGHARGVIDALELSVEEGALLDADIRIRRTR